MENQNNTLSWQTPEYIHTEKGSDWYWIVGIVTVSIALVSIILGNLIFAILVIVGSFTLCLFASRRPAILTITIHDLGVDIGTEHHPYATMESFWIETRDRHPRLLLKSKRNFMPFFIALLDDVPPEEIRHKLLPHLPEEEHTEPFLEKLLIHLGF